MKLYQVSVTYFFWSDDEDHAVEQFADATSEEIANHVNVIEEVPN